MFQPDPSVELFARLKQSLMVQVLLLKSALTVVDELRVKVQVVDPLVQPPLKPPKVTPASGVAVRVTTVPLANGAD